jgi:hypothetical protein
MLLKLLSNNPIEHINRNNYYLAFNISGSLSPEITIFLSPQEIEQQEWKPG